MESFLLPQLNELQDLHGMPVIFYSATISSDSVSALYECLRRIGPTQHLDLVLSTSGGSVAVARRLALLLREFTQHLTILVPYQARSAGTLLCLSANELVLGPMAELGPIEAHISSARPPPPGAPAMISAEDIRAFRQMAEDWFGVERAKDRLQVLALVAQCVFPTSLSAFYRSDRLTRQTAHELLRYQLPNVDESVRQRIVDQFVGGYDAHSHVITRGEAQSLGLKVRFTSAQEEALLWYLLKVSRRQFFEPSGQSPEEDVSGLVVSAHFCARRVQRWVNISDALPAQAREGGAQPRKRSHISWEIDGE